MQEHPIPQDITGYRFHIVGSMTLKQFGEILLGVIVAVFIYKTNLTAVVKWPLILLSAGIGAAAAFIPIEERPLDHWIITFFKVIYRPTKFFWIKDAKIPEAFLFSTLDSNLNQEPELDLTPAKRQRIKEYLGSVPEHSGSGSEFTEAELARMQSILTTFETVQATPNIDVILPQAKQEKPKLGVRVRSMRKKDPSETVIFDTIDGEVESDTLDDLSNTSEITHTDVSQKTTLSTDQVAQDIEIPEEAVVKVQSEEDKKERDSVQFSASDLSEKSYFENVAPEKPDAQALKEVDYNADLPFPIKPTKPNKLVGMVLSQNNDLLSNTIVEVQTTDGHIERAVKTNALGQFFITTPLKVGEYNIVVERDDYTFQPKHIKVDDSIIQPVEIRSDN